MNATDILNNTRNTIISNIVDLVRKIDAFLSTGDKKLKTADNQEAFLDEKSFPALSRIPAISVEVEDPYTDEYYDEDTHITEIAVSESGELCITAQAEFADYADEVDVDDISTDDLAAIATFLETEYRKM